MGVEIEGEGEKEKKEEVVEGARVRREMRKWDEEGRKKRNLRRNRWKEKVGGSGEGDGLEMEREEKEEEVV